ncbi:hypothetical protein [Crocosphaera watsonii]|nr:hypothetical protein [Crocosphaera watsonii]
MMNRFVSVNNVILVLGMILSSASASQALPEQNLSLRESGGQFLRRQGTVSLEKGETSPLPQLPKIDRDLRLRQSRDGFLNWVSSPKFHVSSHQRI